MHLHHMETYISGKKNTTQLHFIEALLLDTPQPTGTISEQLPLMYLMSMTICVCICSHQIHCGCIGFNFIRPSRQVAYIVCAPAVCSWPTWETKFQKSAQQCLMGPQRKPIQAEMRCWMMKADQISLSAGLQPLQ